MAGPTTPNMSLILPALGGDSGTWDDELNTALTTVDSHDHSSGKGVQVPSSGININANLSLAGFGLTSIGSLAFSEVTALSAGSDTIFVSSSDHELYWRTHSGVNVKLTNGSALNVAAFAGGIGGDYSAVAAQLNYDSANTQYTFKGASPTFYWAALASGDLHLYIEGAAGSLYTGIKANASLSSSYVITLPTALPARQQALTLDNSGAVAGKGGTLFLGTKTYIANDTYTPTTGCTRVRVRAVGGGGGGGGANNTNELAAGGGGGSGGGGEWLIGDGTSAITGGTITIGGGGAGGASTGADGTGGGATSFVINSTTYTASGGSGGKGDVGTAGGTTVNTGGSEGGTTATDQIVPYGQRGEDGWSFYNSTTFKFAKAGSGGKSMFGGDGTGVSALFTSSPNSVAGRGGAFYGAGGGGAVSTNGSGGTAEAGGAGAAGIVIIDEFM